MKKALSKLAMSAATLILFANQAFAKGGSGAIGNLMHEQYERGLADGVKNCTVDSIPIALGIGALMFIAGLVIGRRTKRT